MQASHLACRSSALVATDAAIASAKTPATTSKETHVGTTSHRAMSIFTPMKDSTRANPVLR